MARFSIGTAIGDAFGLMRRRPLSVFVWGVLLTAPIAATFGFMLPMMGDMVRGMETGGGAHDAAFAEMMQFQAMSWLLNLIQLFLMVIVYTAVMRAVLRPRETSFFSLRLGMDELRVAVVGVAIVAGLYLAVIVLILVGLAVGFSTWGAGAPMNWLIIVGLVVSLVLGLWLAMARVSLIAPASVLYRSFAFPEGWRLARGQTGALFGMMLLLVLLIVVIEAVVVGVGLAVAIAAGITGGVDGHAFRRWQTDEASPFEGMGAMFAAHWPWFAVGAVVAAIVYGVMLTLHIAPFASACRQLAEDETPRLEDEPSPAPGK